MEKEQFLKEELEKKIDSFKKDSKKHKNLHRSLRCAAFVFTGILSILSGLALYFPYHSSTINIFILIISASAGIFASIEGLRKADELWIHERTTYYILSDLKRELEFKLKGEENEDEILKRFFYRFQDILANSGKRWSSGIVKDKHHNEEQSE